MRHYPLLLPPNSPPKSLASIDEWFPDTKLSFIPLPLSIVFLEVKWKFWAAAPFDWRTIHEAVAWPQRSNIAVKLRPIWPKNRRSLVNLIISESYFLRYHWLSLVIIDHHWLSLIIIDYLDYWHFRWRQCCSQRTPTPKSAHNTFSLVDVFCCPVMLGFMRFNFSFICINVGEDTWNHYKECVIKHYLTSIIL